jgi:hypothetical protein
MNAHEKIGELLTYHELNKKFPENYHSKLDYHTLLYAWVQYDQFSATKKEAEIRDRIHRLRMIRAGSIFNRHFEAGELFMLLWKRWSVGAERWFVAQNTLDQY